jgi:hypothetical protein
LSKRAAEHPAGRYNVTTRLKSTSLRVDKTQTSSDADSSTPGTRKEYRALPETHSWKLVRNYSQHVNNIAVAFDSIAPRLYNHSTRTQSTYSATNAILNSDNARLPALGTSTASVDQLRLPTCSSPEHQRDASKYKGAPTTESQDRNIARTSDDFRHNFTTRISCHPHSYLLTTEECPGSKDLDDLLHQWWHDEDSHSSYDGRVLFGSHAEHYDLCSAHDSHGGVAKHSLRVQRRST